jgi:diguanylate cyclase (GGDEF)-like protein
MLIPNFILVMHFSILVIFVILLTFINIRLKNNSLHLEKSKSKDNIKNDQRKISFQTGLPNRNFILEKLKTILKKVHKTGSRVAILLIDLDNFKNVVNSFGYTAGNILLEEIANRLKHSIIQEEYIVAHMESDEFCVLIENCQPGSKAISLLANDILNIISATYYIKGNEISITASIGISIYPDTAHNLEDLITQSDLAKHVIKKNGKNNYSFFSEEMNKKSLENAELSGDLRKAFTANDQLYLCYQPQVEITTGTITGAEALVRWQHPSKGHISPDVFIPIAEESGLIKELGNFIISRACQDLKILHDIGFTKIRIAINLSAQQFSTGDIAGVIAEAIWESGIEAKYLELELTESLVMQNPEKSLLMLRVLKSMGMELAIDDFGTGYSSLSQLKKFPINSLKIDQSFIHGIATDRDNQAIVTTIISMAEILALGIVVEGVETIEELKFVMQKSSNIKVQGYLFSKPLEFADYKNLLIKNKLEPFGIEHILKN